MTDTSIDKYFKTKKTVGTPKEAVEFFKRLVFDTDREHFLVLNLNTRQCPISSHTISIGTLNSSLVHPREVFIKAIKVKANSMIIAHNHPSGDLEPSEADVGVYTRLKNCGQILGIEVIDSLIMDKSGKYKSMNT